MLLLVFVLIGPKPALVYACMILSGVVITSAIKRVTRRVRPGKTANRLVNLRFMERNFSFPSGDSFQAACMATFLNATLSTDSVMLLIPIVMFARVYFGFHWVGDTIAGALLGIIVSGNLMPVLTDMV